MYFGVLVDHIGYLQIFALYFDETSLVSCPCALNRPNCTRPTDAMDSCGPVAITVRWPAGRGGDQKKWGLARGYPKNLWFRWENPNLIPI